MFLQDLLKEFFVNEYRLWSKADDTSILKLKEQPYDSIMIYVELLFEHQYGTWCAGFNNKPCCFVKKWVTLCWVSLILCSLNNLA